MQTIDDFLQRATMYRLVLYVLGILTGLALLLAFIGKLSFSPTALVVSLAILVTSSYLVDRVLGRIFQVSTNRESALITGLILCLIVQPANSVMSALALAAAGAVASASKFLISRHGKHLFNPAAFAAAVLSLTGLQAVTWWVGSSIIWPFSLILGLAVIHKIRRFPLWIVFMAVGLTLQVLLFVHAQESVSVGMKHALLASPLFFLSTIMLTEPATMPTRRSWRLAFAALVAVLYVTAWKVGPITIYPEVALLLGNIFAYLVSPKFNVQLQLQEVQKVSDRVYNYVFSPDRQFDFRPGQYMEWTLAHVPYDSRGNRRTFTIASSPTESTVQLGVKYYEPASTYKAVLHELQPGDVVQASQIAGDFTLAGRGKKPLAFIAGGIGITPFRSMITYLRDNKIQRDIVLLYVVNDPQEFAYVRDVLAARDSGVRTIPIVTDLTYKAENVVTAKLSADLLQRLIPDYKSRIFYVSGPNHMVDATKAQLRSLHVHRRNIKTDHFSGY